MPQGEKARDVTTRPDQATPCEVELRIAFDTGEKLVMSFRGLSPEFALDVIRLVDDHRIQGDGGL